MLKDRVFPSEGFVFKHPKFRFRSKTFFNRIWTKKKKQSDIKKRSSLTRALYCWNTNRPILPSTNVAEKAEVRPLRQLGCTNPGEYVVRWHERSCCYPSSTKYDKNKHTWYITENHKHIYLQLNILLMRLHLHLVYISIFYIIRIYSFILQESIKLEWFLKASGKKLEKNRTWLASQGQPTSTESSSDLINLCSAEAAEAALKRSFWGFKKFHGPINRSCLGVDMCHVNSLTWTKLLKACSLVWYLNVI